MGWDLPNPGVSCDSCIGRQILYQCATWERDPVLAELVKDFLLFMGLILKAENVLNIPI